MSEYQISELVLSVDSTAKILHKCSNFPRHIANNDVRTSGSFLYVMPIDRLHVCDRLWVSMCTTSVVIKASEKCVMFLFLIERSSFLGNCNSEAVSADLKAC